MFETSQDLLGQILFFDKHENVLWVSFIAIKHKQLSFDVAPMYKVQSDTLLKILVLHVYCIRCVFMIYTEPNL